VLICWSADHRVAPLVLRDALHLDADTRAIAARALIASGAATEVLWLVTCNRIEVYAVVPAAPVAVAGARLAAALGRLPLPARWAPGFLALARRHAAAAAVRHLMRIALGLESSIPGDTQVLAQVRAAYRQAVAAGTVGPLLHRLGQGALRLGREARAVTGASPARSSHAARAAELIGRHAPGVGDLVVIGAGPAAGGVVRRAQRLGAGPIVVINRSAGVADRLAAEVGARRVAWDERYAALAGARVAVVAVGAGGYIVRRDELADARGAERRPLLLVDLSMPRGIDPGVVTLPGIGLWNLDDLAPPADQPESITPPSLALRRLLEAAVARVPLAEPGTVTDIPPLRSRAG
jgi:glutamyl-tRNA reductase